MSEEEPRSGGEGLLTELVSVAASELPRGDRVEEMARCLRAEPGFLGIFTRLDPLGELELVLEYGAADRLDVTALRRILAQELSLHEEGRRGPGVPRQLTLSGGLAGAGEEGLTVVLLWDESLAEEEAGPQLLGGLLLSARAPLIRHPVLFALLEVFQLALSREVCRERLQEYKAGLELVNALQPPLLRGERSLVARALVQFRRVIPFDLVALAVRIPDEPPEVRILVPPECPPRLVHEVRNEMRRALALEEGDEITELYHNEPMGPPAVGRTVESLLVLPLIGATGKDRGRIGFFSSAPGFFTTHHLRLLGLLAPAIGTSLQALHGVEGLRTRAQHLESEQARVEAQLELARRIQGQLLRPTEEPPTGFKVAHGNRMSAAVGGDFFLTRTLSRYRYAMAIADVSGKGLPAGLLMAHTRGALLAAWDTNPDPAHVLARMNRVVFESTDDYSFVTMLVVLADTRKNEVQWACAGHEPILRIAAGALSEHRGEDPPLGILATHTYKGLEMPFVKGETLLMITDGCTDCQDATGERLGRERFMEMARRGGHQPDELVARILEETDAWHGTRTPADDLTCLALGRGPREVDTG